MDHVVDQEFSVPDLIQGKEYLFRVSARNKCGPGEPAYIDEPINMSAPASESTFLDLLIFLVTVFENLADFSFNNMLKIINK